MRQEYDAIIDCVFHSGPTGFVNSELAKSIKELLDKDNDWIVTNDNWNKFVDLFEEKTTGGELNRRQNQAQLFLKGDYNGYASDNSRSNLRRPQK